MKRLTEKEKRHIMVVATLKGDTGCGSLPLNNDWIGCKTCPQILSGFCVLNNRKDRNEFAKELCKKMNNNPQLELF